MDVIDFSSYKKRLAKNKPKVITFYGHPYKNKKGEDSVNILSLKIENGDILGALDTVKREGGVWVERNETYVFIPWPCAAVEVCDAIIEK